MTLYKLVVLGDGGVGKTALTIQVKMNPQLEDLKPRLTFAAALSKSLRRNLRSYN